MLTILLIIGCNENQKVSSKNKITSKVIDSNDSLKNELVNFLSCGENNIDTNFIKKVIIEPDLVLKKDDSCIYIIINDIKRRIQNNKDKKLCYAFLNSIYKKSDGDISEYFIDLMTNFFYKDYQGLSEYLQKNKNTNTLDSALIEALSIDISDANNPNERRKKINSIITQNSSNDSILNYMLMLQNKIDPKKFD